MALELLTCPHRDAVRLLLDSRPSWALMFCGLALAVLCGCSQLVDVEGLEVRCELFDGEPDPCAPLDQRCGTAGVCERCDEGVAERCDGLDNDCDGKVDEGHDEDHDGYSWCGGGIEALADCIDEDPEVHPASVGDDGEPEKLEVCDGKDNDCNGEVDDSSECADIDCVVAGCTAALECDAERGKCIAPRPDGSACSSDVECAQGFCADTDELGVSGGSSGRTCASACCSDRDCGGDDVCVVSGTGLRACLPKRIASREAAGDSCSTSSDCASGICAARTCVMTCSTAEDCPFDCVLNIGTLQAGDSVWACGVNPLGRGDEGDACFAGDPTACKSGLCLDSVCQAPCGSSGDCGSDRVCEVVSTGRSRVAVCGAGPSVAETCCTNADCANDGVCRPDGTSGSWSMYCD